MMQYVFPLVVLILIMIDHHSLSKLRDKYPSFLEKERVDIVDDYLIAIFGGFFSGASGASIHSNNGFRVAFAGVVCGIIFAICIYIYDKRKMISEFFDELENHIF